MRSTRALQLQTETVNTNGFTRQRMQTLLNAHNYTLYGQLIQLFADRRLLLPAKQLHARFILSSTILDNFLASKLINLYSKTNHLREAHYVFGQIPNKNTFSFNALLIGYTSNNRFVESLKLFSSFCCGKSGESVVLKFDNFTISCVLKAFSELFTDATWAKSAHCLVLKNGFDSDVFIVNGLLTFYSRCDDLVSARCLFNELPERDLVTWNSLISGYSQGGFYEECKELYEEMLGLDGLSPNGVTIVSVLQACAHTNDLVLGMEVHKYVIEKEIQMDLSVCNSIIALYAKCGSLEYARDLFEEMSEKDEITYGALISGYMVHGFVDKALCLFREMRKPGLSTWNAVVSGHVQNNVYDGVLDLVREMQAFGFKPNSVTLSSILPTISYFSNLKGGKEIHAYAIRSGYDHNIYVATAIVDTYGKLGFLDGARTTFDQAKDRSVIIWTAIISAYAAHGNGDTALFLFNDMQNNGVQPDPVTFTSVLAACAHSGLVSEAQRIFDSMVRDYVIHPLVEHYACMVGVFSRAGQLKEALEFIKKMPIEPSATVWGALLNGASVSGDVDLGKLVCDHLFEIEPENTGNYIIMANLYAKAGRWEEAERVRDKMKNGGLNKIAGSSWVETSDGIRNFIAKDVSNERSEEVYDILERMLLLMREEGYVMMDEFDEESVSC